MKIKLKDLAEVLGRDTLVNVEIRRETDKSPSGYEILSAAEDSSMLDAVPYVSDVCGDMEVVQVYPVVFAGERRPSLVIWVKKEGEERKDEA